MPKDIDPVIVEGSGAETVVRLCGAWNVQALRSRREVKRRNRALAAARSATRWDLTQVSRLDAVGAVLLWRAWGGALPAQVDMSPAVRDTLQMVAEHSGGKLPAAPRESFAALRAVGDGVYNLATQGVDFLRLLGMCTLHLLGFIGRPLRGPWKEISAQLYYTGAQAMGITALVGFLIGVVLSYLSAEQLALFGASVYIVDLLGVSIVRELGPVLAAILVAGRSGSAITAQLGVMSVTQELDAMSVMGISPAQRLVMPRVVALAISLPLVVIWTDFAALLGGALVAAFTLDLSLTWFVLSLREVISITNFWIGIGKGIIFGVLIALIACHYGLRIEPNTESLGRGTTASVVSAITAVILADAICAILLNELGW